MSVEADKVLILLRALPQPCRQWIVLNSPDESFQTYVDCALRYEAQQRIWSDLNGKPIASLSGQDPKGGKGKDKGKKGKGGPQPKGGKDHSGYAKGKGVGSETRTCFHCNERGHLATDCPKKQKGKGSFDKSSKGDPKGGKGKDKGKKGEKGSKGKTKGKRATEFSQQPESEAGSEIWSEPDIEEGGRLSMFASDPIVRSVSPFFICQSTEDHDPFLWLVDSGASRTVVSAHALKAYKVIRERELQSPIQFRTASGEQVAIGRECMLEVFSPHV